MEHDADDLLWEAFVTAVLAAGPAEERRSRYGDKPALFTAKREIAHLEAPGVIDLRITGAAWSRVREDFRDDPAVHRHPSRRDWIELHLRSTADLDRLGGLLTAAMAANALLARSALKLNLSKAATLTDRVVLLDAWFGQLAEPVACCRAGRLPAVMGTCHTPRTPFRC